MQFAALYLPVYNKNVMQEEKHTPQQHWQVREAAERLKKIRSRRDRDLEERRKRARKWGYAIAGQLGQADPSLKRVIGFGSVYETWRNFREDSDIDLAIQGGDWSYCTKILPSGEFKVSLVELDLQNQEFTDQVLAHGEVLYERS